MWDSLPPPRVGGISPSTAPLSDKMLLLGLTSLVTSYEIQVCLCETVMDGQIFNSVNAQMTYTGHLYN
jgi:hypothetical protein